MDKLCIITGAGSGVGRATAIELARKGWKLALVGRRRDALEATHQLAGGGLDRIRLYPVDVGDPAAVESAARRVAEELGVAQGLVNSAGTNVPQRALEVLSLADYHAMLGANLHGAYYWTQAVLPGMRAQGHGTIVNVVSDAGKLASPKAGPGYVVSKFGLAGLTQSINAEERGRGIRACAIFPGDINTPLLDKRPVPPDQAARDRMMQPEDVAACVIFCLELPPRVIVEEMLVRPR
jgi:NAD(P)-dependent dehydrogenase (short-subunit alcohol dehydrogenase family)